MKCTSTVLWLSAALLLLPQLVFPQLSGTKNIPGNYPDLAAAITDLNTQGVGAGGVILNLVAGNPQTAPAGGYVIGGTGSLVLTTTSVSNTITIQGNSNTITTSAALTVGALNDAIFKLIGADWVTITGFTMLENAANIVTAAGTNTMTEWGVALLYVTTTDGAQNNTIQNNTIDLNRTYQNTFGIYSNSTHTATAVTTSATATGAAGGNSPLKIYGNSITDVNQGIVVVGPTAAADNNDGLEIGGTAPNANTITNYGTTGTFSGYANVSGTVYGILVRNTKNYNVSFNNITSSSGASGVTAGTLRGIYVPSASNQPTGTFTNNINNNTLAVTSHVVAGTINGISVETTTSSPTSTTNMNNNNFTTLNHTIAAASGAITAISQSGSATAGPLNHSINNNTFTNLTSSSTGSFTFISNSWARPTSGVGNINSNSIVTAFNKTGAGGTVTLYTSNSTSGATVSEINTGNNFSNITVTGATTIAGWATTDGGSPSKTVTGNTFSNWVGGTSAITGLAVSFSGAATVSNNIVSNISSAGTLTGIASSSGIQTFSQNTVHTLTSSGAAAAIGIASTGGTTQIYARNKIYNIENTNAAGTVNGIAVSAGTTTSVYNNLIGDLRAPSATTATTVDAIRGINITSTTTTSNVNIYYNTIYINATSTGANFYTSGIFHTTSATSTTAALNMRNNVIVNTSTPAGTGITTAYRRSSADLTNYGSASNNNDFYAGTPSATNLIFYDGTNSDQTIGAYKTRVAPRDAASFTENPTFVSTVGSNANFLHINTGIATQLEGGANTVAGITDDYDGDVRNVTTPDVGADEFSGVGLDLTGPGIAYTPLGNTASTSARTLTATITDPSGVPTAGAGLPVLYWRINAGGYSAATATSLGSNQYQFSFGSGVITGDAVSYYICAQDNAGTPNVSCSPSAGASGFSSNPPAVSTPPTTPSSYSILSTISGSFTVGAAGTYSTLTAAIADINAKVLNGPVTLNLIDPTYATGTGETFPISIIANGGSSATNTLTIRPSGAAVTISGAGNIFTLNGASYVTINGITLAGAKDAPLNDRIRNRDSQHAILPTDVTRSADVIKSPAVVSPKAQPASIASDLNSISAALSAIPDYSEKIQQPDVPQEAVQTEIVAPTDNIVVNPLMTDGGVESLLIRNASAAGSAITFINDATNNTVKNATIESGNTSATSGTILFSTSTGTLGNSNNTIDNNKIRDRSDAAGVPANAIYSSGTVAAPNATNTVNFSDIFNYTTTGILLSATGIGNGWAITNNGLFQTAARTAALTGISVQGAGGHTVFGNFIGGSDAFATGSPTTISTGLLQGISLLVTSSPTTVVSNNLIVNLSNTGTSFPNFNGIIVAGGNVNILNNTIGGGVFPPDTVRTNEDTYGFRNTGTGTVLIEGNTFGNVRNYLTTLHDLRGIMVSAGTATIRNNTIRDVYDVNAPSTSFFMAGITLANATPGNIVEGNTVYNLSSNGTGASLFALGMFTAGAVTSTPDVTHIRRNRFYNITGQGTPSLLYGIYKLAGDATYSNNMIALGDVQTLDAFIGGIRDDGAAGTNNWYFNSVSITGTVGAGATGTYAFFRSGTATVNIRDNIFADTRTGGTGAHVTIANTNAAATGWGAGASNYNILNGAPGTIGQWLSTGTPSDFATWQTNSAGDANSSTYGITFVSATDVHLNPVHNGDMNLKGIPAGGITVDFDNQTRDTQAPYIGADELGIALPIQLAYLNAVLNTNGLVNVRWGTVSEINNFGFEVQKSQSMNEGFATIPNSFVPGHGTTNDPHDYAFVDNTTQSGSWFYRLKQIDLDGSVQYTEPVHVDVLTGVVEIAPKEFSLKQNYPNPFNPETTLKFSVENTARATLEVYNVLGQKVATLFDDIAEAGQYYKLHLNGTSLASGMYIYSLQSGTRKDVKKMLLMK